MNGRVIHCAIALVIMSTVAGCGGLVSEPTAVRKGSVATSASSADPAADEAPNVARFGTAITYANGSTLICSSPVDFRPDQYAFGGEKATVFLRSTCTLTNRTGKTLNPVGTTGSMSAGGVEGDSIYQNGLTAPKNPILDGRSVTWSMGFGITSREDVQMTVSVGFLNREFPNVTFVR